MRTIATLLLAAAGGIALASPARAMEFTLDRAHSSIEFKVSHLAISKVRGEFKDFEATFTYEPGRPEAWSAEATIDAASIDTGNEQRDEHLRSADFFAADDHPEIVATLSGVTKWAAFSVMMGRTACPCFTRAEITSRLR